MTHTTPALVLILTIGLAAYGDVALAPSLTKPPILATRRIGKFNSLSGIWSGEYAYPRGSPRVPFNALIEEKDGAFTGQIDEPNTYADPVASRLYARLAGTRHGGELSFVKTMDGTGGVAHSIFYEGRVDADFTRIDGRWSIPAVWSGVFFMERSGAQAEAAVARSAEASEGA